MLDWPRVKVNVANQNSYNDYPAKVIDILNDKSLVKNIVRINSLDMELYEEALSLRTQRKNLSSCREMHQLSLKESQSRFRYNCKELQLN